jgi:hypothetical protein
MCLFTTFFSFLLFASTSTILIRFFFFLFHFSGTLDWAFYVCVSHTRAREYLAASYPDPSPFCGLTLFFFNYYLRKGGFIRVYVLAAGSAESVLSVHMRDVCYAISLAGEGSRFGEGGGGEVRRLGCIW